MRRTVLTKSMQVLRGSPPWNLCIRRRIASIMKNEWNVHDNNLVSVEELVGTCEYEAGE